MNQSDILSWAGLGLAAATPLLVPLVAWFLEQRGVARRTKEFEALLKRTELVDKLQSLYKTQSQTDNGGQKALDAEVQDILGDLAALRQFEQSVHLEAVDRPLLRRTLLLYKQASIKRTIYQVLFYIFGILAIFAGIGAYLTPPEEQPVSDILFIIFAVLFYLGIAFLFRWAAVRDYRKKLERLKAKERK